ncbi:MAG: DMT family transporter, partial [Pseudomonadota bacterium]
AATFFIASVQVMPLADALAIFFVAPLLLTALSWAVLGERVGWRRLSACLLGFLGALIVVRPSFAALGPAALMPLATAATFVVYLLLTRRVAQVEGALAMQAWAGVFGAALMGLGLLLLPIPAFDPGWPPIEVWPLYIGGAAAAIVGHLFLVAAFARAPASLLAPLQYLELVTASVAGLLLFGDFPDLFSWLGILLIVGSGLFVLGRERAASHG